MALVEHVEEKAMPRRHRRWNGNDTSERQHHARVPVSETPMFLRLSWRRNRNSPAVHVANLKLDLPGLLAGRYVRKDGEGHVRFFHDEDGCIWIQTKSGEPRLVVRPV
jgi:hypothetical protein